MTTTTMTKPIVPALSGLYDKVSPLAEPLMRATAGLMLMPHGAQKLFGWFGGYGLEGTGGYLSSSLGLEPGFLWALLLGSAEFFGGLLLAIGLLTRPAGLAIAVLMAVAVFAVHWPNGYFWNNDGYEYPLMWGLIAFAFVLRGGGRYSLDARIGREF